MSSVSHYYDVCRRGCDVGLRRSWVHGGIKRFGLLFCSVYLHTVLNKTIAKFVKNVFIRILDMSNVYDLVGQPS